MLKKKRVNGKWRYYYDDSLYKNAQTAYRTSVQEQERTRTNMALARSGVDSTLNKINNIWGRTNMSTEKLGDSDIAKKLNKEYEERVDRLYSKTAAFTRASKSIERTKKAYAKAQIKHVAVGTIAKGAAAVANFLSKLSKKK